VFVTGFGVSSDATHVTAPDRAGTGLAAAAAHALRRANVAPAQIDLVNAHGTATPFNDAAEARALRSVGIDFERAAVHAPKGALGHALGAAGVLETLAAFDAMERGLVPATAGGDAEHPIDPDAAVPLLEVSRPGESRRTLKLSAAFGGVNAALVLSDSVPREVDACGPCTLSWSDASRISEVPTREVLAAITGASLDRMRRVDALGALVLAAVVEATLDLPAGWLVDKALVVQTSYATVGRNERFFRRILERSAASVEPRLFPGTSPNLAAAEASILLGIRGPVLTLGGDPRSGVQADLVAEDLIRAGQVDAAVVVYVEEASLASAVIARAAGCLPPESAAIVRVVTRQLP